MTSRFQCADADSLHVQLSDISDPVLLRNALESVLDYLDRVTTRAHDDDILHVSTYLRRLIHLALNGQNEYGVTPPPEMPSD